MAISASYLPPPEGAERDPSAYAPELSRRARGFATWAMIRQFGRAGIAEMVETCCGLAGRMAHAIAAEPGCTLVCPAQLNQFMIRFGDDDALTRETIRRVQADAVAFIGGADWRGRWVMRCSVTSSATDAADTDATVASVLRAWRATKSR